MKTIRCLFFLTVPILQLFWSLRNEGWRIDVKVRRKSFTNDSRGPHNTWRNSRPLYLHSFFLSDLRHSSWYTVHWPLSYTPRWTCLNAVHSLNHSVNLWTSSTRSVFLIEHVFETHFHTHSINSLSLPWSSWPRPTC